MIARRTYDPRLDDKGHSDLPLFRNTSREAYESILGELPQRQQEAWELLKQFGPCTARELNAHRDGIWKRLSELRAKGAAKEVGTRKCSVSGRNAIVWDIDRELVASAE